MQSSSGRRHGEDLRESRLIARQYQYTGGAALPADLFTRRAGELVRNAVLRM